MTNTKRALLLVAPLLAVLLGAATCEGDQCTTEGDWHYDAGNDAKAMQCVKVDGQLRWQKVNQGK